VLRCSKRADSEAEVRTLHWHSTRQGITARVATPRGELDLASPLIGEHNLDNLLLATGCGLALGIEPAAIKSGLRNAVGAPGRLQQVPHPADVLVFVDYAHTPDALCRVLATLRRTTTGRLIAVFGCGGDRDAGKRPLMGKAAAELADLLVLTSDNPRTESAERILAQIEDGVRGTRLPRVAPEELPSARRAYVVQPERRAAIKLALAAARSGDTVLLAGKGHEKFQIIGDSRLPFDDCVEAAAAIAAVGGR
jgi:UDP-N-acetylmuramyl-tripeptide synthetase